MSPLIWLTLGLAIGAATSWLLTRANAQKAPADPIPKHPPGMEEKEPYSLRSAILTPGERSFYEVMRSVLPSDYTVLMKVRLGDIVNVTYGARNRQEAYSHVCSKSLDFVICDSLLSPVVAVEIVDGGSDRSVQRNREFVDRVLAKIQLPIERIPLRPEYEISELRAFFAKHIELHTVEDIQDARVLAMSA
jgi:hypothetical protein